MVINATSEGINAWDADIRRYVDSDRIPVYEPIEEYLFALPNWDGKDRIRELALNRFTLSTWTSSTQSVRRTRDS